MDSGDPMVRLQELKNDLREIVSFQLETYSKVKGPKSREELLRRIFRYLVDRQDLEFSPNLINAIVTEVIWDEGYFETVANWRLEK